MAIALVHHSVAASTGNTLTITATTAGNLVVVQICAASAGQSVPTSIALTGGSGGGTTTFTQFTQSTSGSTSVYQMAYCFNCQGGATGVSLTGGSGTFRIFEAEFSGIQSSSDPIDVHIGGGNASASTTLSIGSSFTPANADDLVLYGVALGATTESSWTAGNDVVTGGGTHAMTMIDTVLSSTTAPGAWQWVEATDAHNGVHTCSMTVASMAANSSTFATFIAGGGAAAQIWQPPATSQRQAVNRASTW